jgi:hypothetical protein
MASDAKVLDEDADTGAKKYRYIKTGTDHFSLAFTYAWMACESGWGHPGCGSSISRPGRVGFPTSSERSTIGRYPEAGSAGRGRFGRVGDEGQSSGTIVSV